MTERARRAARWERWSEWPLLVLAVAFLVAYAVPVLDVGISPSLRRTCDVVQWVAWAAFAVDYVVRLVLAEHRARWAATHALDLVVIALPLLRPLRLLRLVALLNVVNRHATIGLRGRVVAYLVGGAVLLSFLAALAVLDAERHGAEPNIQTFGDAWWWSITTMTTVGYGDRFPTTGDGRLIGVGLMIGGITLLGSVTATLASWLSDRVRAEADADVDALTQEIRALRLEIAALNERSGGEPDQASHGVR
ncbi:potassium channel family protein [Luteipulveratus mongoliensis]|uniref:Ion transporter n=1 Tax=Luteipulveratus mongoliensis TaxID=571913 RepID=A0A0K1JE41_9MICO|nr:potassium channel family protein [Luteipulveratus mongoliensis]AKU14855.1 ion transporter [Luteipulveratus mongoliensis]